MNNKNHTQYIPNTDLSFNMIFVEGGTFDMGDDNGENGYEKPKHKVALSDFYMSEYLVTQTLWTAIMGHNPSHFKGGNRPVESVSWNDIVNDFLPKLNKNTEGVRPEGTNYRLPTEAEWEYAARGGKYWKKYTFIFSGSDKIEEIGWFSRNSYEETMDKALKTPNLLEIYDMTGNIWELCQDYFQIQYYTECFNRGVVENPCCLEKTLNIIMRGGSLDTRKDAAYISYRRCVEKTFLYYDIGFRLVLSPLSFE